MFALVFAVMASYVLVVSVSAARANQVGSVTSPKSPAASRGSHVKHARHARPGTAGRGSGRAAKPGSSGSHASGPKPATGRLTNASLNAELATALRPIAGRDGGNFAVGIVDETTGAEAVYHGGRYFHAASVENADMLAALLLQHQESRTPMGDYGASLCAAMMKSSDNDAANGVWDAEGGQPGVQAANQLLGLHHTGLNAAGHWGLTSTTVTDQLRLLADLTRASSPLHAAARRYALQLMADAATGQRWGASAAASPGAGFSIRNGWLPDPMRWVINSIGVMRRHGQELLIAVLSKGNATEAGGISLVRSAAVAAMHVVTQAGT